MEVLNFRKTADTNPFFCENVVLKVMLFFEQINLKGNWDKENFFSRLPDVLAQVPAQIQVSYLSFIPTLPPMYTSSPLCVTVPSNSSSADTTGL